MLILAVVFCGRGDAVSVWECVRCWGGESEEVGVGRREGAVAGGRAGGGEAASTPKPLTGGRGQQGDVLLISRHGGG